MSKITNTRKTAEIYTHRCLYKIIISAIFAIATTIPTYATNITANNKGCDHDNLSTYSGDATLEATWSANTVNITWYKDGTAIQNVGNAGTCQYDGTLTLPTPPSKNGYTFAGWKVKTASAPVQQCNLSTWDYGTRPEYGLWNHISIDGTKTSGNTTGLTRGQWRVEFGNGIVTGSASCSNGGSGKAYSCYCEINSYIPNGGDICNVSGYPQFLITTTSYSSNASCEEDCARNCSAKVEWDSKNIVAIMTGKQSVNSCSSINDRNTCLGSYSGNYACIWNNSACQINEVADCSTITDSVSCENSFYYVGGYAEMGWCLWDGSSCKDRTCDNIENEDDCTGLDIGRYGYCEWYDDYCEFVLDD